MSLTFAPAESKDAIALHLVPSEAVAPWMEGLPEAASGWCSRLGFSGAPGQAMLAPDGNGGVIAAAGYGSEEQRKRSRFPLAAAAATLPEGTYRLETDLEPDAANEAALSWLLAGYRFDRYKSGAAQKAKLVAPAGVDAARIEAIASGEALTRDLINTPASDMGPDELEDAARALASEFGADIDVTVGDTLLEKNFPLIHAVGRASPRAPRLIDMRWGQDGPAITLVGKGVCFDTGGLNLKPGASMGLMKKDMGGAAHVLGLARTIMALGLRIRLRVLVPAAENSVSGNAFRPGDVLTARNGKTIEINNTDAEGRLVLADALAYAGEETPDRVISMATLTGAARVAVGPDIAPFFTDDEDLAAALSSAARRMADPVWRLPFHEPYEAMIEPAIADLDNAPKGGFAGAITAALFLRRFAAPVSSYTHFDIYAWNANGAPGRPVGALQQGARAILGAIEDSLS
ncbi:M17 family metallopeptidase [Tropicimonas sp. IMCC34011]|uniref:leucyl aminopeptidase family protein n=1 Tax=Tropicimonas sp. IMCC34011 TaxID=2248759 RepID=UPI000E280339|nr:leucyl aminopeptidase family protein [Tropicimonas sp. IMCC34011]